MFCSILFNHYLWNFVLIRILIISNLSFNCLWIVIVRVFLALILIRISNKHFDWLSDFWNDILYLRQEIHINQWYNLNHNHNRINNLNSMNRFSERFVASMNHNCCIYNCTMRQVRLSAHIVLESLHLKDISILYLMHWNFVLLLISFCSVLCHLSRKGQIFSESSTCFMIYL